MENDQPQPSPKNTLSLSLTLRVLLAITLVGLALAFLHSYISSLGFWLAVILSMNLALPESGPAVAALVFLGIVIINGFAENVVKPKYMGTRLNLSPLMVVFSVIFWAAILGPLGAILGVPVTVMFKELVLEADQQNRWIAKLMSSSDHGTPDDQSENGD
jgi:predicted PurR-regulated permease PerM